MMSACAMNLMQLQSISSTTQEGTSLLAQRRDLAVPCCSKGGEICGDKNVKRKCGWDVATLGTHRIPRKLKGRTRGIGTVSVCPSMLYTLHAKSFYFLKPPS